MKVKEIREKINVKKEEVRAAVDKMDAENAKKLNEELRALKDNLKIVEELEKEDAEELKRQKQEKEDQEKRAREEKEKQERSKGTLEHDITKDAKQVRAIIKDMLHKPITQEERALLATGAGGNGGTTNPWGANGEGYILPQTISTTINKLVRQYKSFRTVLGYQKVSTLTGSIAVEGFDTVTGLIDFDEDGNSEIGEDKDIKFINKKFALAAKGALIPIGNTLLQFTDQDLMSYISDHFAKKAVITENEMAVAKLLEGKTVKDLADWKALKKSINVDLDPASLLNACICTNQDGFNMLDSALDNFGRPILQSNPTDPTQKMFVGIPMNVFSNYMLPSTTTTGDTPVTKAPIFYGDCMDSVKFVDPAVYNFAISKEAGFTKNMTIARVIEYLDLIQLDSSDKAYIAGEITVA